MARAIANRKSRLVRTGVASSFRLFDIKRVQAAVMVAAFCLQVTPVLAQGSPVPAPTPSSSSAPLNLDLSSTTQSLAAPAKLGDQSVIINNGGTSRTINSTSLLTPGERVAVWQVLSTGQQAIQLGSSGQAVGGDFTIGSWLGAHTSSLVIPQGVTAFNNVSNLTLTGDLTNSGVLNIQPGAATVANVSAANIYNNVGALITSLASLNLTATGTLVNAGQIYSGNDLTVNAASIVNALPAGVTGIAPTMSALNNVSLITNSLTNSGTISAINGNMNLASLIAGNINVNNTLGTLLAQNGSIDVRDALFSGKNNFSLFGGDVLSKTLNIWSGTGSVKVNAGNVSGLVNVDAGEAHFNTAGGSLNLGNMHIVGDPTYYNTGSININGAITTNGNALAIIAGGDITNSAGSSLTTTGAASGGDVLIVAGASFTTGVVPLPIPPNGPFNQAVPAVPGPGLPTPGSGDIGTVLTLNGGTSSGGKIDLSTGTLSINSSGIGGGNGGNIMLLAFGGTGSNSGSINLTNTTITSSSVSPGANGNIVILGGSTSGTTITTGAITSGTSGASASSGLAGQMLIATASPIVQTPVVITNGAVSAGAIGIGPLQNSSILVTGALTSGAAPIVLVAGSNVSVGGTGLITNGSSTAQQSLSGDIAIFAGGNIATTAGTANFNTSANNAPGGLNAGNVYMVAGANTQFVTTAVPGATGLTPPGILLDVPGQNEVIAYGLQVSGPSATGGNIDLSQSNGNVINATGKANNAVTHAASNGGNVTLAAFAGTNIGATGGQILTKATSTIATGGVSTNAGNAVNGNVMILAGAPSGTGLTLGNVNSAGTFAASSTRTTSAGAGSITIATAAPTLVQTTVYNTLGLPVVTGLPFVYTTNTNNTTLLGAATTLSGTLAPGTITSASATIGNLSAAGGSVAPGNVPLTTDILVNVGGALTVGSVTNTNNTLYEAVITPAPPALPPTDITISVQQPSSTITLISGGAMTLTAGNSITSNAGTNSGTPGQNTGTGVSGGTIAISAQSFNLSSPGAVAIQADGTGGFVAPTAVALPYGGDGGNISITTTGTTGASTVNVGNPLGTSPGFFTISAKGDTTGGNGGTVAINSGGSINIDTASFNAAPQSGANSTVAISNTFNPNIATGNGAQITLKATTFDASANCATGCVYSNGTLDASGSASTVTGVPGNPGGNGGVIAITTNSANAFNIGGATVGTPNGVAAAGPASCVGCLTANGNVAVTGDTPAFGSGGTVSVQNMAGGITVGATSSAATSPNGATGSIQVQAANGFTISTSAPVNLNGYAAGAGGHITLQANGAVVSAGGLDASGGAASASQPGGNGGSIEVDSNSGTLMEIGSAAATGNGVAGNLTARGDMGSANLTTFSGNFTTVNFGSGGSVTASNVGSGGIKVDSAAISVAAAAANAQAFQPGGDGGNINLYAPTGGVEVDSSLDASGGAQVVFGASTALPAITSGVSSLVVPDASGYRAGQLVYLSGTVNPGTNPGSQPLTVLTVNYGTNTVTFTGTVAVAYNPGATLVAYYQSGNGGKISVTANSSTAFTVSGSATTNGVQGTVSANGFSGGTISLTNLGSNGIVIGSNALSVAPSILTALTSSQVASGGNGGNIALLAPSGPVSIASTLNVSGGTAVAGTGGAPGTGPIVGGNGGNLLIVSNPNPVSVFTVGSASLPANGIQGSLIANGGLGVTTNGNAGNITVINNSTGGITVNSGSLTVTAFGSTQGANTAPVSPGNGGAISLRTNGALTINGQLIADGGAGVITANQPTQSFNSGLGGSIYLSGNNGSVTPLTISPVGALAQLSAKGSSGGQITVINNGSAGIVINNNVNPAVDVSATAGSGYFYTQALVNGGPGGSISLQAPNGPVLVNGNLNANGGADGGAPYNQSGTLTYTAGPLPITSAVVSALANTTGLFSNQFVTINLASGNVIIEQISTLTANSINLQAFFSDTEASPSTVQVSTYYPGGNGGQISILSNSSTPFIIGSGATTNGVTGTLSAIGGGGANGGSITVTNLGAGASTAVLGGISLPNAANLTVAAGAGNAFVAGGAGGSIFLNALGSNSAVLIGTSLNANSGTASALGTGAGGTIGITVNTSNTVATPFIIGTATNNGITGTLSATGSSGGSIGVKQLGTGGITAAPANIVVTASAGSGGKIDLEAATTNSVLTLSAGTLSADASAGAGSGGSVVLNAWSIVTPAPVTLSAQGPSGGGGTVVVNQLNTAASLALGTGNNLSVDVTGPSGGNILVTAGSLSLPSALTTSSTGTISLNLTGAGAIALASGSITTGTLTLTSAKGDIGAAGVGNALATTVSTLSMTAQGATYISNTGALTLNAMARNAAGNKLISITAPSITVSGVITNSGSVLLNATGGNVTVDSNIIANAGLTITASGGITTTNTTGGSGILVGRTGGVTLTAGSAGITSINTSTGTLALTVNGGAASLASVTNTGNVLLSLNAPGGLQTLQLINSLGSITTSGALGADVVVLNNQSSSGLDSYSITLGGTVGSASATSVILQAAGNIVQTNAANVIQANYISLSSQNGNIGTLPPVAIGGTAPGGSTYTPIFVNLLNGGTAGTLSVNVQASSGVYTVLTPNSGQVNISNTGSTAVQLNGVLSAGDFQFVTAGGITSNGINSRFGGITVRNSSAAAGSITLNGNIAADGGPAVIENDNLTASGTINVANYVTISGYGRVYDSQASPGLQYLTGVTLTSGAFNPATAQGSLPANVTFQLNSVAGALPVALSTAYFGAGLTATGSPNAIVNVIDGGSSAYKTAVVFNGANASTINLGSGATITSKGTLQAISTLDLSNATVTTGLTTLAGLAGSGVTKVGQNYRFANTVSLNNVSALVVPVGSTITLQNFILASNQVAVNIPTNNTATIAGTLQFNNGPNTSQGRVFVNSITTTGDNVLSVTGSMTSDKNLMVSVGGKASITGTLSATTGQLSLTTGMSNVGTVLTAPPGTMALSGTVSAATLILDSSGSILQTAGTITATNASLSIGGTNFGTSPLSQASFIALTASNLTVNAGSGAGTGLFNTSVTINENAGSSIGTLTVNMQRTGLYLGQAAALNVSGSNLGAVILQTTGTTNITVVGNLSCGSCTLGASGALTVRNASVSSNNPVGLVNFNINPGAGVINPTSITLIGTTVNHASGSISLLSGGAISLTDTTIQVGTFSANSVFGGAQVLPTDIAANGSITITSSAGGITTRGATSLRAIGGNLTMTASGGGNVSLEGLFEADGGNVTVLAGGNVNGSGPTFTANAIGTMSTNSTGGGIEITSGSTTSGLAAVFNQTPGSVLANPTQLQPDGSIQVLGGYTNLNNTRGLVIGQGAIAQTGTGYVNLSTSLGASTLPILSIPPSVGPITGSLNLNAGALLFNAQGSSTIQFNGSTFNVNAYTPIVYKQKRRSGPPLEVVRGACEPNCRVAHVLTPGQDASVKVLSAEGLQDAAKASLNDPDSERITPVSMKLRTGTAFVNPLCDVSINTQFGLVYAKKGSLLSVTVDDTGLRVAACSGPNHVKVQAGNQLIAVAPGEELLVSDKAPTADEQSKADGIGRRKHQTYALDSGLHANTCEFSLLGLLSNSDHLETMRHPHNGLEKKLADELLKYAASIQTVTKGRGVYNATAKLEQRNVGVPHALYVPVSLNH